MEGIVVESRVNVALLLKPQTATIYLILSCHHVRVVREHSGLWEGKFTVVVIINKMISVTDCIQAKLFKASRVLLIAQRSEKEALKSNMQRMQAFVMQTCHVKYPIQIFKMSEARTKYQKWKDAIEIKFNELLRRVVVH